MTALPQLVCAGYTFSPKGLISGTTYYTEHEINPMEPHECGVNNRVVDECKGQGKIVTCKVQKLVNPSSQFPINQDLECLASIKTHRILSSLGSLISVVAAGYLFILKKNYNFSVLGTVTASGFAIGSWWLNKQGRNICFNIAKQGAQRPAKCADFDLQTV